MSLLVENYDLSQGDNSWSDKVSVTDGYTSFQIIANGLDAADLEVKVQYSNNNTNFNDVPNLSQVLPTGDSNVNFNLNTVTHRYYKVVVTVNSATSGTITIAIP